MNSRSQENLHNHDQDEKLPWLESNSLIEALGIENHFAPDENAPAVDENKIRAYFRRELNEGLASETEQMIATFRSWHEAWQTIAAQERCAIRSDADNAD